ncbi:MAG: hypothetical protein IK099_05665 [Clostridia bacterium]|nr:hypothetical protein [Clostridia bacterium]
MHCVKKFCIFVLAVFLCCAAAFAETQSPAADLWNSGCDLLFHTSNVTVSGEASFSLEGKLFKTAKLHYIQDGFRSFYDLTLLTPRINGDIQETGWTIIADEEGYRYIMEAYTPGVYHIGTGRNNDALLRRTVRLDALTDLGGLLVAQADTFLPDEAVTVAEENGLRTVHLAVKADQLPDIALSALNLAAGYLSDRWFSFGYDRTRQEGDSPAFDNYVTVTEALTDGTVCWTLRDADVVFTLDSQNRLTSAKGTVRADSVFWDQSVRQVEMHFELAMSDYGASQVKTFDPADYNVVLADEAGIFGKTISPITVVPSAEDFSLCASYARLHDYDPDTNMLEIELIAPEVFERKDVESLSVGDSIVTGGQTVLISSISQEYGYIILNQGDFEFSDESVWLTEDTDGNYRPVIYEDFVWTEVARIELPITDKLLFLDLIVPESGEMLETPTVHPASEFKQFLAKEDDPGFTANNTMVAFDQDGALAIVERFYVPWQ